MGGLQVSFKHLIEEEPRDNRIFGNITGDNYQQTLSSVGILALARARKWIYITPESIADRSKANALQKGLVSLQIAWMGLQCISRKANGLPLTHLEVYTMIHVLFAIIAYSFWFKVIYPVKYIAWAVTKY